MAPHLKNYRSVLKTLGETSSNVQKFYSSLNELIEEYVYEVSIAYGFLLLERAQNTTIYCGLVKNHGVDREIAQSAVDGEHFTRKRFRDMYGSVLGKKIPESTVEIILFSEKVRDKIMHGKSVTDADMRKCLANLFRYSDALNDLTHNISGFLSHSMT